MVGTKKLLERLLKYLFEGHYFDRSAFETIMFLISNFAL